MRFNHLDLQVSDVHAARAFFETHLGLRCTYIRRDEIALLEDDIGFAFGVSNFGHQAALTYPSDFHVGFVLEEATQVEAMYKRLKSVGVAMKYDLREGGPNLYFTC